MTTTTQNLTIDYRPTGELRPYANNARTHSAAQIKAIARSIETFGFTVPILIDGSGTIIAGHGRLEAAGQIGMESVPTIQLSHLTDEQRRAYIIADNKLTERGGWDKELLTAELADLREAGLDLELTGFEAGELDDLLSIGDDPKRMSLSDRFLVPPFSILDARQGYWQARKREWLDLGLQSELGRGDNELGFSEVCNNGGYRGRAKAYNTAGTSAESGGSSASGTSVFDPVLCEVAYRWFCPPASRVLDPFAGGSVRGIVASRLRHHYTGIELRPEQVEANRQQAEAITRDDDPLPQWIEGDSQDAAKLAPGIYDFILSCPPYADLEVYSDDPRDLSTMSYDDFREMHARIIAEACGMLKDNRFAVWVVGEVRGPDGSYRGFVRDTINAFEAAGLKLWNDAVLVTAIGSLPIRVGTQMMKSRKLGKTHQDALVFFKGSIDDFRESWALEPSHHNVLVFTKGNGQAATRAIGDVDVGQLEQPEPETEAV
jgi:hypothetical protein